MVRQSIIFPVSGYTFPMKNNFIRCGICGWCLELLWTGFLSFRRREWKLTGHSSLWMFPIYGMAAFLKPLSNFICSKKCSFLLRGFLYMLFIFTAEYMSGSLLKKHHCCPWDYSGTHFQINGVIRLDYAPLWFFCGLLFEYLNQKNGSTSS